MNQANSNISSLRPSYRPIGRTHFVALMGSERLEGNSQQVLQWAADYLGELGVSLRIINLAEHDIQPCGACGDCNTRTEPCGLNDGVKLIVEQMKAADGIIYASPVHAFGLAEPMQRFLERAGVGHLRFERPLANKVAGVIVTGRRYSHMDAYTQLMHNILLNRMILVGSGYPAILMGGRPGSALQDEEGMSAVREMLRRMVDMAVVLSKLQPLGDFLPIESENEREAPAPKTSLPIIKSEVA